jgi:hypothetical protein
MDRGTPSAQVPSSPMLALMQQGEVVRMEAMGMNRDTLSGAATQVGGVSNGSVLPNPEAPSYGGISVSR